MPDAPRTPEEAERWRQALARLDLLIELPDAERRAALEAIDDPLQRALLHDWLAAHEGAGVLDGDVAGAIGVAALRGRQFGRWRLEEEIGRGGMAVVWRARSQVAPLDQQAAVKVLSVGALAQHGGAAGFLREQQLLSRMRHPGIAALFDAGVAADGTPWYAMALVDGARIDAWCDQRALDVRARIELLLQVCEAVAYAHRNLVIHRDIKPSNVLVDDDGHARLMDFGIARLAEGLAPERTATAVRMLTPEYAAPEQFEGAPAGTAMDVYGLGGLLYRLLSGHAPRAAGTATDGALPPPSRVVRNDAARPQAERAALSRRLRGDLDTIVAKALAFDPMQRYASVDAFAEDLRRWRDRRPIRARPPSLRYRAGRFAARNRWGVAAAAALLVVLGAGVAGIAWQGEQARRQAERAELTQAFLREVFAEANPLHRGARGTDVASVLRDAARQARMRFADRPDMQVETLRLVGELQALNGDNTGAIDSLRAAHALQQAHARGWDEARRNGVLALANVLAAHGQPAELRTLLEDWLSDDRATEGLSPQHCKGHALLAGAMPAIQDGRQALEAVLAGCLRLPAATPERIAVVATLSRLRRQSGDVEAGMALVEAELPTLPAMEALSGNAFVERIRLAAEHAHGLRNRREYAQAESVARTALQAAQARIGGNSPLLAPLLQTQGNMLNRMGEPEASRAALERALALIESHGEVQYRGLLASLLLDLGVAAHLRGDDAGAERYWRRSLQAHADAGMESSTDYGMTLSNLAYVLQSRGAYREAADMAGRAVAFQQRHAPGRLDAIALAEFNWCMALAHAGDAAAIAHCQRGVDLDRRYTPDDIALIGEGQQYLADAHCLLGQWQPALEAADRAIALLQPLHDAGNAAATQALYFAHHHRAEALAGLGRREAARRGLAGLDMAAIEWPSVARARRAAGL